eukprot:13387955-Heterocapsa_arctica.AAC.1
MESPVRGQPGDIGKRGADTPRSNLLKGPHTHARACASTTLTSKGLLRHPIGIVSDRGLNANGWRG